MKNATLRFAVFVISIFCLMAHAAITGVFVAYKEPEGSQNDIIAYLRITPDIHKQPTEYKTYYIALPGASHEAKGNLQFLTQFQPVTENLFLLLSPNDHIYLVDLSGTGESSFQNPLQPVATQRIQSLPFPHPDPRTQSFWGSATDTLSPIRVSAPFLDQTSQPSDHQAVAEIKCYNLLIGVDGFAFLAKVHSGDTASQPQLTMEQFHPSGYKIRDMNAEDLDQYTSDIGIITSGGKAHFLCASDVRGRKTKGRDLKGPFVLDHWNEQLWKSTPVSMVSRELPFEHRPDGSVGAYNTRDLFNLSFGGTSQSICFHMHHHSCFLFTNPLPDHSVTQQDITDGKICIKVKTPNSPAKHLKVGRRDEPFKTLVDMVGNNLYCVAAVSVEGEERHKMSLLELAIDPTEITPDKNGGKGFYKQEYTPPESILIDEIPLPPATEGFHAAYDLHKTCDFSQIIRVKL